APPGTVTSTVAFSVRERFRSPRPAFVSLAVKVTEWPALTLAAPFAIVLRLARTRATQRPLADDEQRIRMPRRSAERIRMRAGMATLARTPDWYVTVVVVVLDPPVVVVLVVPP